MSPLPGRPKITLAISAHEFAYVADGGKTTYCIYDGPTPESIRRAASVNGLPVDRIREVRVLDPYFYA